MTANKNVSFGFGTMRLPLLDPVRHFLPNCLVEVCQRV